MATGVVEKLVYEITADFDPKGFNDALLTFSALEVATQNMVKKMAQFSTAILGAISVENRFTSQQSVVADALGVSVHLLEGYSTALSGVGVGYDDVAKFMENFQKKSKGVKTALAEIGLGENADFQTAFEKLLTMDKQKASAYASKLFGSDASKALAYAIEQGINMADVQSAIDANFLTDEAIEGAKEYNKQLSYTYKILRSITKQFSGLLGKYLTPIVKKFNEWLKVNKEFLEIQLHESVKALTIFFEGLFAIISTLMNVVSSLIEVMGGLGTVINMITLSGGILFFAKMAGWVQLLVKSLPAIKTALISAGLISTGPMTAGSLMKMGGIFGAIGLAYLMLEDVAVWMGGGKSLIGRITGGTFEEWKKDAGTVVEMFKDGSIWTALRILFGEFIGWLWDILTSAWDSLGVVLDGFIHNLIAGFREMWNSLPMPDFMKVGKPEFAPAYNKASGDVSRMIRNSVYNKQQPTDLMKMFNMVPQSQGLGGSVIPRDTTSTIRRESYESYDIKVDVSGNAEIGNIVGDSLKDKVVGQSVNPIT